MTFQPLLHFLLGQHLVMHFGGSGPNITPPPPAPPPAPPAPAKATMLARDMQQLADPRRGRGSTFLTRDIPDLSDGRRSLLGTPLVRPAN